MIRTTGSMEYNTNNSSFAGNNFSAMCSTLTLDNNNTCIWNNTIGNNSNNASEKLPRELTFTDDSLVSVIAYSVLFIIAATGNLTVFITLLKHRDKKSRVNLFIMHLCMADMIVTFIMMPMEIGWHLTVSWTAGDIGCRILMFFRAFGFYLSSFVLIAISLDRYFAIAHPLSVTDANRRGKIMLTLCWLLSTVASSPQSVIFHEERHPSHQWYAQCVTFNFFPDHTHELMYNLFNVIMLYAVPLTIIVITYSMIVCEITKKTKESRQQTQGQKVHFSSSYGVLRRSGMGNIERARCKSLKMSIVIVAVFIICWTPYFVISAWWWIDRESAGSISPKINRGLFIFAVSNSCVNPIVYGMFTRASQREILRCLNWLLSKIPHCCYKKQTFKGQSNGVMVNRVSCGSYINNRIPELNSFENKNIHTYKHSYKYNSVV